MDTSTQVFTNTSRTLRDYWYSTDLVNFISANVKPLRGQYSPNHLNSLVLGTLQWIEPLRANWPDIEIATELQPDLPLAQCDHHQLSHALFSLLSRILDALPQGGKITVRTGFVPATHEFQLVLTVFDAESPLFQEKSFFDPFFNTNPAGKGVELELYLILRILLGHQGRIQIEMSSNTTTIVRMTFPERIT